MFKKILSQISFSPTLVSQLGFYANRLKKEEVTRRLGLIFVALALVVQSLVVFYPSESANAANPSDMVPGGLGTGANRSFDKFMKPYDANLLNLRDIMNHAGITREEILQTKFTSWRAGTTESWGLVSRFSYAQGERAHRIFDENGNYARTVYSRPIALANGVNTQIWGWVGYSKKAGWFAIMQACGNLVTTKDFTPPPPESPQCPLHPSILASDEDCKPCPGKDTLWVNDPECMPAIEKSKNGVNISQGSVEAASVTARANDQIAFTLTIENTGLQSDTVSIVDSLQDTLEYAVLIDNGGGTLNETTKILSWPNVEIQPGQTETRNFTIKILSTIPSTPRGQSDATSYDCLILNTFGNSISIPVDCPPEKIIETTVTELPRTGPAENIIFGSIILAVAVYFYLRAKLTRKEIRLVRRHITTGAL